MAGPYGVAALWARDGSLDWVHLTNTTTVEVNTLVLDTGEGGRSVGHHFLEGVAQA
jgi:hypothetical protein